MSEDGIAVCQERTNLFRTCLDRRKSSRSVDELQATTQKGDRRSGASWTSFRRGASGNFDSGGAAAPSCQSLEARLLIHFFAPYREYGGSKRLHSVRRMQGFYSFNSNCITVLKCNNTDFALPSCE